MAGLLSLIEHLLALQKCTIPCVLIDNTANLAMALPQETILIEIYYICWFHLLSYIFDQGRPLASMYMHLHTYVTVCECFVDVRS